MEASFPLCRWMSLISFIMIHMRQRRLPQAELNSRLGSDHLKNIKQDRRTAFPWVFPLCTQLIEYPYHENAVHTCFTSPIIIVLRRSPFLLLVLMSFSLRHQALAHWGGFASGMITMDQALAGSLTRSSSMTLRINECMSSLVDVGWQRMKMMDSLNESWSVVWGQGTLLPVSCSQSLIWRYLTALKNIESPDLDASHVNLTATFAATTLSLSLWNVSHIKFTFAGGFLLFFIDLCTCVFSPLDGRKLMELMSSCICLLWCCLCMLCACHFLFREYWIIIEGSLHERM